VFLHDSTSILTQKKTTLPIQEVRTESKKKLRCNHFGTIYCTRRYV